MPTLCLCMMVKNEAHVIERALQSVRPYIDYWVICDTGSTDETPNIILNVMDGIAGELHHTQWVGFGHNRTEIISLAKGKADYILIMDADMIGNVKGNFKDKLIYDFYEIRYEGALDYTQPMLVSNRHNWEYVGVTHEYIFAETAHTWDHLPELTLTHFGDGGCRADKFERDIELLTKGLQDEPDNERYIFYMAQSYKDLGQWENALHWYEKRIVAGGWEEEQWYSMYQAAEMKRQLQRPWPEVLSAYLTAFDARPIRLEPVYAIAKYYRERAQYFQGYLYSSIALKGLQYPHTDKLFIEKPVYECLLLLEYVVCALACGKLSECIEAANIITYQTPLPLWVHEHAVQARKMASERMHSTTNEITGNANRIKVIVPFFNAGVFLQNCVRSLQEQDYDLFEVIFIDDASTDENRHFTAPDNLNAKIIRNNKRKGAAYNLHRAIVQYCDPDDIVVLLDGDDWLACSDALSIINNDFEKYDCWVLYGQYKESDGPSGISQPFASVEDFGTLRKWWRSSHIKSFRAGLFHSIADQDPDLNCLKDKHGKWLHSAVDAAIIFPLMEMAGFHRTVFNEKVLYIYNIDNLLSHHHNDREQQSNNFDWVCSLRPFAQVMQYSKQFSVSALI